MKRMLQTGLVTLLLTSTAHAINPPNSMYFGVMLGATQTKNVHFDVYDPFTSAIAEGNLTYKVFGNVAVNMGYRCQNLRLEGELFLNSNPFNKISVNNTVLLNKRHSDGYSFKGQTNVGAFMANAFYDFFSPGENMDWAPYVGAGIGYSSIKSKITLYQNNVAVTGGSVSDGTSAPAAQGIVGLSYYLDDYSFISLDYRYFTTKKLTVFDVRKEINSINFSFVGAFG